MNFSQILPLIYPLSTPSPFWLLLISCCFT
nr:MAG TPA: hypothetical protein [Caudoviricetes sp.]